MEIGAPSNASGQADQFMHKNRLQQYAQRATLPLPIYQTVNEGSPHAPQFRSSVVVDGQTFTSPCTFVNKKAAEQDVARIAFEGISTKIQLEGVPLIQEDSTFCKSILYEYATKMNFERPTYTTSQGEGLLPIFVANAVFNGETFTGIPAKNKKEAEQMAARAAIESILANSNTRTLMCEIIKSKGKLYAAVPKGHGLPCDKNIVVHSQVQANTNFSAEGNKAHATLNSMHTLPGNAYFADGQHAHVTATPVYLPQAIKVEGYTYTLSTGTGGNGYEPYAAQGGLSARVASSTNHASKESHVDQVYQMTGAMKQFGATVAAGTFPTGAINVGNGSEQCTAQGGLSGLVNSTNDASKESHIAQDIQVVDAPKQTGTSTEHGDFPTGDINTGRKRTNEQEQGDDCKKARTEQPPPTLPSDNTESVKLND